MNKPIPESYWIVPGKLLAGEYPGDKREKKARERVQVFLEAGVGLFVDLTHPLDHLEPYDGFVEPAMHVRIPIVDESVPEATELTRSALNAIDTALDSGKVVYVHCWGGIGRTGVIVGCWLSEHGFPGTAALHQLGALWQECSKWPGRSSPENDLQRQYIAAWHMPKSAPGGV